MYRFWDEWYWGSGQGWWCPDSDDFQSLETPRDKNDRNRQQKRHQFAESKCGSLIKQFFYSIVLGSSGVFALEVLARAFWGPFEGGFLGCRVLRDSIPSQGIFLKPY